METSRDTWRPRRPEYRYHGGGNIVIEIPYNNIVLGIKCYKLLGDFGDQPRHLETEETRISISWEGLADILIRCTCYNFQYHITHDMHVLY